MFKTIKNFIYSRESSKHLKQPTIPYNHKTIVNFYIVYELDASSSHINDPTLKNCLFGAITLTKNADIYKYGYSGYGIGLDGKTVFFIFK